MQLLEVVQAALDQAPADADRLLCWIINSAPPARRHSIHERFCAAIHTGRLTGELDVPIQTPQLFTAESAEAVWEDLQGRFGGDATAICKIEPFFKPSLAGFVPQAYPGRYAPTTWNRPLSPAEVRAALHATDKQVRDLKTIAQALVDAGAPKVSGRGERYQELKKAKVRVAVLPYGDGLPMTTLLYAVKDLVPGMEFGPASFYEQKAVEPLSRWIGEGFYNAGYATCYQLGELRKAGKLAFSSREVYPTGFIRSLLLRMRDTKRDVPQLNHLSFVGQFGPDRTCKLDSELSDPAILNDHGLTFQERFTIAQHMDPMANWEIPLILAFAGGVGEFDSSIDGLALTISTDAHLWAASFGLNLEADRSDPFRTRSFEPAFRRAAWDPDEPGASAEDSQSELHWFVPEVHRDMIESLARLVAGLITRPVGDALDRLEESDLPTVDAARRKLGPVARCLLAPLLTVFPNYRGPMLFAPPEAWLTKLQGPGAYVSYRPPWHRHVKDRSPDPDSGRDSESDSHTDAGPIVDYVQRIAS